MKTTFSMAVAVVLVALIAAPAAADITMTFEEFVGSDTAPLATFYSGITFQSGAGGSDWVARDATSNNYNISSWPSGQQWNSGWFWIDDFVGATTALNFTGNDGIIGFDDQNATYVELSYAAASTLWLEAYDVNDNLIDSDSGPSNLRFIDGNESGPGTLRVDSGTDNIAYVIVHDFGNQWIVDNITTDATGIEIIPAPGAALLGVMGLGMVGWVKRRFS